MCLDGNSIMTIPKELEDKKSEENKCGEECRYSVSGYCIIRMTRSLEDGLIEKKEEERRRRDYERPDKT